MKKWEDAPAEMRQRWAQLRAAPPECWRRVTRSDAVLCVGDVIWWHPDIAFAFCELHVPTALIAHFTRFWQEDEDPIVAGVAYELREERRRAIAASLGPKTIVFAPSAPLGMTRGRR